MQAKQPYFYDLRGQDSLFPTHEHAPEFWEYLGRAIATYGFLEWALGRACFALESTTPIREAKLDDAIAYWAKSLTDFLSNPLGALINSFEKSLKLHPQAVETEDLSLIKQLRDAKKFRDVLCHGSWQKPDLNGGSIPLFVNRSLEFLETPIDRAMLDQTQVHVAELALAVMNTVTGRGIQFPGTHAPSSSHEPSE